MVYHFIYYQIKSCTDKHCNSHICQCSQIRNVTGSKYMYFKGEHARLNSLSNKKPCFQCNTTITNIFVLHQPYTCITRHARNLWKVCPGAGPCAGHVINRISYCCHLIINFYNSFQTGYKACQRLAQYYSLITSNKSVYLVTIDIRSYTYITYVPCSQGEGDWFRYTVIGAFVSNGCTYHSTDDLSFCIIFTIIICWLQ